MATKKIFEVCSSLQVRVLATYLPEYPGYDCGCIIDGGTKEVTFPEKSESTSKEDGNAKERIINDSSRRERNLVPSKTTRIVEKRVTQLKAEKDFFSQLLCVNIDQIIIEMSF